MFDIRREVETYTGRKIDLNQELDKAEKEIKKEVNLPKEQFKAFRNLILAKEKKSKHSSLVMQSYLQDNTEITFEEYKTLYEASHSKDKKHEQEEVKISAQLAIGATLVLASGLLAILSIEIPVCMSLARWACGTGVSMIVNDFAEQRDQRDKNKQQKGRLYAF